MINPILLENAVGTFRNTLDMPKIRALCGLPEDAKIALVPNTDGTGNFSLVAEWSGAAPVIPATAPVEIPKPKRVTTKPPPVLTGPPVVTEPAASTDGEL